jgi:hypothetical protein
MVTQHVLLTKNTRVYRLARLFSHKSGSLKLHLKIFSHLVGIKYSLTELLDPLHNNVWEQNEIQCK